jgi:hypothetical protein
MSQLHISEVRELEHWMQTREADEALQDRIQQRAERNEEINFQHSPRESGGDYAANWYATLPGPYWDSAAWGREPRQ